MAAVPTPIGSTRQRGTFMLRNLIVVVSWDTVHTFYSSLDGWMDGWMWISTVNCFLCPAHLDYFTNFIKIAARPGQH